MPQKRSTLADKVEDLGRQVDALKELPGKVDTVILALGGSPLVTDKTNPHHPSNSIVGQVKASGERQREFEERVQQHIAAIREAGIGLTKALEELKRELAADVEKLEKNTLNKKTLGEWFWKYKVRIALILLLLILEGPNAWSFILEYAKSR